MVNLALVNLAQLSTTAWGSNWPCLTLVVSRTWRAIPGIRSRNTLAMEKVFTGKAFHSSDDLIGGTKYRESSYCSMVVATFAKRR